MSLKNFLWQNISREDLSEALFGNASDSRRLYDSPLAVNLGLDSIAVGYSENIKSYDYAPPSLVLLDKDARVEIFSWLRVHSPEIFPVSQFARVLTIDDWGQFCDRFDSERESKAFGRSDRWASLIVGEIIAQGEVDIDLSKLPLSRAAGCFSSAMAKTHLYYGRKDSIDVCISRLRSLAVDKRFSRRHVSVDVLEPIWEIIFNSRTEIYDIEDALDLIFNVIRRDSVSHDLLNIYSYSPELMGNSIEQRVVGFNRIINELKRLPENVRRTAACSAIVAISAFLVGRGTSHEFLVRRNLESFPFGPLWYGLMAGLVGARYWEENWARTTKGVERPLKCGLRWEDSSGFDLCWSEYQWYASTFEDMTFSGIPKLVQRVLSVEVVPGASCQFLIGVGRSPVVKSPIPEVDKRQMEGSLSNEVLDVVAQLIKLAAKAEALTRSKENQATLFEKAPTPPRSRTKKAKGA